MTNAEILEKVKNRIIEAIPEAWESAILNITRVEGSVGFTGGYFVKGNARKNLEANFDFFDGLAVHELYSNMINEGKGNWNKLEFNLFPSGDFETDFIWDQAYQDEIDGLNKKLKKK